MCDEVDSWLCDVAVVFDLVLELVFFDEIVELPAESSRLVDVITCFVVGEDVVYATGFALFFVTALETLVLGLNIVSRGPDELTLAMSRKSRQPYRCVVFPLRSLNADQIKIVFVKVFFGLPVLALLPTATFSPCFGLVLVFVLVGDEARAFLYVSQQLHSELWRAQSCLRQLFFVILVFLLTRVFESIDAIRLFGPYVAALVIEVFVFLFVAAYVGDCVEKVPRRHYVR